MEQQLDKALVQDFARRLFGHYTSGFVALMVDVGYRTGLFEALADGGGTSEEIAGRAGLHERYVRGWLGAMATGGVVSYDPSGGRFTLPTEHAICLTGTSSRNLAPGAQFLTMLAPYVRSVSECFRRGGGVPYSEFMPDFTEVADASWRLLYDGLLIKGFLPTVEGLPQRLERGIQVADLGCGTGHAINVMARQYSTSSFVGYDLDKEGIARGTAEAADMGLVNARFEVLDVTKLPDDPKFDLITSFDAIHDQQDPAIVLRRVAQALAPDGVYLMIEPKASSRLEDNIGNPFAPYLYGVSVLHCLTVSLAEDGAGLGTAWGNRPPAKCSHRPDSPVSKWSTRPVPKTASSSPDGRNPSPTEVPWRARLSIRGSSQAGGAAGWVGTSTVTTAGSVDEVRRPADRLRPSRSRKDE